MSVVTNSYYSTIHNISFYLKHLEILFISATRIFVTFSSFIVGPNNYFFFPLTQKPHKTTKKTMCGSVPLYMGFTGNKCVTEHKFFPFRFQAEYDNTFIGKCLCFISTIQKNQIIFSVFLYFTSYVRIYYYKNCYFMLWHLSFVTDGIQRIVFVG